MIDWRIFREGEALDPPLCPVDDCGGLLFYTDGGPMSTTLSAVDRAPFIDDSLDDDTATEKRKAVPLEPPDRGTGLRIVGFPPAETESAPDMHRTASLDYAYIIEGEIYAVMDDDSTLMRAGDVLIQRGTNHGWANRSDRACRVLFVLLDAEPIS
ncbi:cupin domain-containing protein [Nocardia rosealba]|uniref:cupin domain-containing protein n=1 Tax=Nocardia rosealba TaxID=2878563 RepID=UPI001CD9C6D0|nr:cupin domain-containing protein [Nocardia rosealba]MCA2208652.1 cupin domain-containing protein [Nocardia rosealba]